jgi:hypothetical protein
MNDKRRPGPRPHHPTPGAPTPRPQPTPSGPSGPEWAGRTGHSGPNRPLAQAATVRDPIPQRAHPVTFSTQPVEPIEAPSPPLTRSQRRRAERRRRTRFFAQFAAAVAVVSVVVTLVLVLGGGDSSSQRGAGGASSTPTVSGASLADPQVADGFLSAAASDIAAVTTYDYRHLDDALNAGLAVTTGAYRAAYREALTGDLARTASAEHVVHTFEVLDIGIGEINTTGTQAKVLVFGRQRVTDDQTGPEPDVSPVTLTATMRKNGNRYLVSALVEGANAGLPPGGPDLSVAARAARTEVVNTLSYRRDAFDVDLRRALEGATSPLREQLQKSASDLRQAMTKGKYDIVGTVTATAVVRADADTVTLLVAADERRLVDGANTPGVTRQRDEVTVTRTADGWAASRISSVDGGF